MNQSEKCDLLKDTIYQLYSKEGRTKSYIGKLLKINRKFISQKIKEWDFPEAEPKYHLTKKNEKILNRHKNYIISELRKGSSVTDVAKHLNVSRGLITKSFRNADPEIKAALEEKQKATHDAHELLVKKAVEESSRDYHYREIQGEQWRGILGYPGYEISDCGRVRGYAARYKRHYLIRPEANRDTGRLYVSLAGRDGKSSNLNIARLVGFAFLQGHSKEKNTINHKDGNVLNNRADNLEWLSQSENIRHSYQKLNRSRCNKKRYSFSKILYRDRYEFGTVAAFAKFLGMSETQTRRYLDHPEKYGIEFIK